MLEKFGHKDFDEIIVLAKEKQLKVDDIAKLAKCMAESGEHHSLLSGNRVDIPSTGGPSSLSTLICPYALVKMGKQVSKLGVKGRPAGGIDVLAQIPNYGINFSLSEVDRILRESGYCHFIADSRIAPLDADFFKYRSSHNAKAIPELVVASILAKKMAVGVNEAGLDIRYFTNANFGSTYNQAKKNGELFVEVAKQLNIKAKYFLTDIANPLQPYIGRGEALLALKLIFEDKMDSWLKVHYEECLKMALNFNDRNVTKFSGVDLYHVFEKNLIAQGSSLNAFLDKVSVIENAERIPIVAQKEGILHIDLLKLRDVMVDIQSTVDTTSFPDNIGVILYKKNGRVEKGECLATLRIHNFSNAILESISSAFNIIDENN